ncbi:hypothetical protein HPB47_008793 [Ixodes persulcatus]|uniref:Uncharacterized protein n=1 Tax=Ixodes persulcatus TaxID=34615 RepID=A0AC60P3R4_IXOPE|nr:hypothetical protein HPB47_008793 [Ixodes persulcatus]
MVAAAWKVTRTSIIINCFKRAGFVTSIAEAASGSAIPQDDQEEAMPSPWEELRRLDKVVEDVSFTDYVRADANTDTDTMEALDDGAVVQLVSGARRRLEDAENPKTAKAPVPAPIQVMDAIDPLRLFAGDHEGAEYVLNALKSFEKSVRPLLIQCTQAKLTSFFAKK